ncbi:MAG: GtrA family protein [Candidatus Gracilibacteria bacterium]|nr:GtrA family protein [Candidatus Gracilibacteria bacterium]
MIKITKKVLSYKIFRYFIGGGLAAGVDLAALYFFVDLLHFHYILGAVCAFVISFLFGFLFQKFITFSAPGGNHLKQGMIFLLFQLVGLGLNLIILSIFVGYFGFYYMYVAIVSKGIIFIWNFTMNHFFNFK